MEAIRPLLSAAHLENVPVIFSTVRYDDAELRAEALRVGACGYVLKEDLSAVVRTIQGAAEQ